MEFIKYFKINTIFKRIGNTIVPNSYSSPLIEKFSDLPIWRFSEKYNGENIKIEVDNITNHLAFKGRDKKKRKADMQNIMPYLKKNITLDKIHSAFNLEPTDDFKAVLFGEAVGGKIIGLKKKYSEEPHLRLFDIFVYQSNYKQHPFIIGWWLNADNVMDIAKKMEIPHVWFSDSLNLMTLDEIIELVNTPRTSHDGSGVDIEGYIGRVEGILDNKGIPLTVKLKCNDFTKLQQKIKDEKWLRKVNEEYQLNPSEYNLYLPIREGLRNIFDRLGIDYFEN